MRIWTAIGTVGLALATLGAGPCDGGGDGGEPAADAGVPDASAAVGASAAAFAVKILDSVDQDSALLANLVDDVDPNGTAEEAAAFATTRAQAAWTPSGCIVVNAVTGEPAHLTFSFAGCAGPFALTGVRGTLDVIYSAATGGGIRIDVTSHDLEIAGRGFEIVMDSGTYSKSGAARHLAVDTLANINSVGESFARTGSYVSDWDEGAACRSLDGQWDHLVGSESAATSMATGLVRCAGGCPQGGGSLSYTDGTTTLTIGFGGGREATWTAEDGTTGTVPLPCGH